MSDQPGASFQVRLLRSVLFVFIILTTIWLLKRVESGELFLFQFSWDRAATPAEIQSSQLAARWYHTAALITVFAIRLLLPFFWSRITPEAGRQFWQNSGLFEILTLATVADLASTLWFFHVRGIDLELHPGLQLLSAALGLTVGPIAGKGIQWGGLVLIGMAFPRWWPALAVTASAFFFSAAAYNTWLMLSH